MSRESCPFVNSEETMQIGQDFLVRAYVMNKKCLPIFIEWTRLLGHSVYNYKHKRRDWRSDLDRHVGRISGGKSRDEDPVLAKNRIRGFAL